MRFEPWMLLVALSIVALFAFPPRRRGCRINDLSRWKQFGGTLERPGPPSPSRRKREDQ